jgi:hypothetical protein
VVCAHVIVSSANERGIIDVNSDHVATDIAGEHMSIGYREPPGATLKNEMQPGADW